MREQRSFVVAVSGPTASGKSSLGISLAKQLSGEVINADSVQLYTDATIGSAKITNDEMDAVPHHLLSVSPPNEPLDVAGFVRLADGVIGRLAAAERLPIIVGGTGLYLRALLCGLVDPGEISYQVTAQVDDQIAVWEAEGMHGPELWQRAHQWLEEIDPQTAAMIRPLDSQRIRRALLVAAGTGQSLHQLQQEHGNAEQRYDAVVVGLFPERDALYERINQRVELMFAAGLVDEVKQLRERYGAGAKVLEAIGYRHVALWLDGELQYLEMVELMKRDTRRFAKRQLTWWRNQPEQLGWNLCPPVNSRGKLPDQLEFVSEEISQLIRERKSARAAETLAPVWFVPVNES